MVETENGDTALALLEKKSGEFDLVFPDIAVRAAGTAGLGAGAPAGGRTPADSEDRRRETLDAQGAAQRRAHVQQRPDQAPGQRRSE